MSKRAEEKAIEYADKKLQRVDPELWETGYSRYRKMSVKVMDGSDVEEAYQEGYEQAEKDTIKKIREQVKQWMPEKDGEEHTYGERLAFNSVLHLLEEMEED